MAFDLTVHRRNAKGAITDVNPYTLHIKDGVQRFERPPGSGMLYSADGTLVSSPAQVEKKELPQEVKAEMAAKKPVPQEGKKQVASNDSVEAVLLKAQT